MVCILQICSEEEKEKMKAILSIILFIGYWFVLSIFLGVFLPYFISDEDKAINIAMLLALPVNYF